MANVEQPVPSHGPLARVPSGVLVLGAIASVQLGAAIATTLFATLGPGGTVFERLAFGALILLAFWRPRLSGRSRPELMQAAVFGLVLAAMNLTFYESLNRIPIGIAVALEFVGPLTVALLGSRRALDLLWVALAAAGILILTNPGGHSLDGLGVLLALLAGCFWGAYIVLNARLGQTFPGGAGLALGMLVGAVAVAPLGIAEGGTGLVSVEGLALGGAIGLLSSVIPYSFELEALRRIAPPVFGVLMSLEPGMAAVAGFLVVGQPITIRLVAGIVLVAAASVGATREGGEVPVAV